MDCIYCVKCEKNTEHTLGHADDEVAILHCSICNNSVFYGRER